MGIPLIRSRKGATWAAVMSLLLVAFCGRADAQLDYFGFSGISSPQSMGANVPVTITARDEWGDPYTGFTGLITIVGWEMAPAGTLYQVNFPYTDCETARMQVLYRASEVGEAADITSLSLGIYSPPAQTFNNFTVRLKHTTLSSYSTAAWETGGWTTVYHDDLSVTAAGLCIVDFDTHFAYNGADNLLLDISFSNGSSTSPGVFMACQPDGNRTLMYCGSSSMGDPLDWVGTVPSPLMTTYVPLVVLNGPMDQVPLTSVVDMMTDGVWSGSLTLTPEGHNVRIGAATYPAMDAFGLSNAFDVLDSQVAVAGTIGCNETVAGSTLVQLNRVENYSCRELPLDGPEVAYSFATAEEKKVTASVNDFGEFDMMVLVLEGGRTGADCIGFGNEEFIAEPGTTYYFVVESHDFPGPFQLTVNCEDNIDPCAPIEEVSLGDLVSGNTVGRPSIRLYYDWFEDELSGPESVYTFTPEEDVSVQVKLSGTGSQQMALIVLTDFCEWGPTLALYIPDVADSGPFDAVAGETYYLVVDGYLGAEGPFELEIEEYKPPMPVAGATALMALAGLLAAGTAMAGKRFLNR